MEAGTRRKIENDSCIILSQDIDSQQRNQEFGIKMEQRQIERGRLGTPSIY